MTQTIETSLNFTGTQIKLKFDNTFSECFNKMITFHTGVSHITR